MFTIFVVCGGSWRVGWGGGKEESCGCRGCYIENMHGVLAFAETKGRLFTKNKASPKTP
ncbi:hypothetical protein HanIR_Chr08g0359631 [Helianthus annuus]|nr:hypothetical protein HanIR_Chr08g0359631 [Helianthus annuus]